jgi:hypothetical protein
MLNKTIFDAVIKISRYMYKQHFVEDSEINAVSVLYVLFSMIEQKPNLKYMRWYSIFYLSLILSISSYISQCLSISIQFRFG